MSTMCTTTTTTWILPFSSESRSQTAHSPPFTSHLVLVFDAQTTIFGVMKIPADRNVVETRTSYSWRTVDGVVCSVGKQDIVQQKEDAIENLEVLRRLAMGKPVPMICDIRGVKFVSAEAKNVYGSKEYAALVKSMALIVDSVYSKINANYMSQILQPDYPSETFKTYEEALAWSLPVSV